MGVAVYCARIVKKYIGAQAPISTRHAAATRFIPKKMSQVEGAGRPIKENVLLIQRFPKLWAPT